MHEDFWHERWRTGQIGFHQSAVHPFLERHWTGLRARRDARVYVPLCGKSLDMVWLAELGQTVVGSELSPIAIREFFTERGLEATRERRGTFVRHTGGPYEIFEGDALALTPDVGGNLDAAYDRAALVALPPAMRPTYAATLARLLPGGARLLLIAFEYPQELRGGPPFSVEQDEVRQLFAGAFSIERVERLDVLAENPKFAELGIPALHESAYAMERR